LIAAFAQQPDQLDQIGNIKRSFLDVKCNNRIHQIRNALNRLRAWLDKQGYVAVWHLRLDALERGQE